MICTHCHQKEANFHYQQINNGQKTVLHLCTDCAKELGYFKGDSVFSFADPFNFNGLLNQFLGLSAKGGSPTFNAVCDTCGETFEEFRSSGFLGCDHCYDVFADAIESMLQTTQPDTTHRGKVSGKDSEKILYKNRLKELKDQLQKAILDEKYEKAAELRDEIRAMEQSQKGEE